MPLAALLFSKKKGADEFDLAVELKGGSVKEGASVSDKKLKLFTVTADGADTVLGAKDEKEMKAWVDAIKANLSKEGVAVTLAKKKQSAMMAIKKARSPPPLPPLSPSLPLTLA
jgi:hypothetical protein